MIKTLFSVLEQGLKLWNTKEAKEYLEKVIKLKRQFYEEYNKPIDDRSNAVLDNIERELCIIADTFASNVAPKDSGNK